MIIIKKLNRKTIETEKLLPELPIKIVQFGEGNFLRGFLDWMVQQMNKQDVYEGSIAAIQPTPHGKVVPKLAEQDGLYTTILQGKLDGKVVEDIEIISVIKQWINPYENWEDVLRLAESEDVELITSNTTEAGITYSKEDYPAEEAPLSFPGKLVYFLFHRYQHFKGREDAGVSIVPCELVERNGEVLKEIVQKKIADWSLPDSFARWLDKHVEFCSTLPDRIVTGYPRNDKEKWEEKLGYEDRLITTGEPFHLFAVDADQKTRERLPLDQAGLNIIWGDIEEVREMKVRLLNAPHTLLFAPAFLAGINTVTEMMSDATFHRLAEKMIVQEILPVIGDNETNRSFAYSVLDRFANPFMQHQLTDLGMNCISKLNSRVLPLYGKTEQLDAMIGFSLASVIAYLHPVDVDSEYMTGERNGETYQTREKEEILQLFASLWRQVDQEGMTLEELAREVLQSSLLWEKDLSKDDRLLEQVTVSLQNISKLDTQKEIHRILNSQGVQ